jgi:uncharacterized protein
VNGQDRSGRTALHYAALASDVGEAEARLADGEDPAQADLQGFTPLHFAAQAGSAEVALLLLKHHAPVDQTNKFGNTPLFTAVFNSRGHGQLIELLRHWGADPLRANHSGQTPVSLARMISNYDVAQYFADLP